MASTLYSFSLGIHSFFPFWDVISYSTSPPVEIQNHTDVLALPFTLWCQRATDRAGEDVEWRTSQRLSNLQFVA